MVILAFVVFFIAPLTLFFILRPKNAIKTTTTNTSSSPQLPLLPKSYPIFGTYFAASANNHRRHQWFTELLQNSPSATFVLNHLLGPRQIITANPAVVHHILKSNFPNYQKGESVRVNLSDFLGDGIFCADGQSWKFQRQLASYEFNAKSLRKFVETVVDAELHDRLLPILATAAESQDGAGGVLDLQDILQRFAFDNICKIAFGYDPAYLLPSLPQSKFAVAFDAATKISGERSTSLIPLIWKIKRFLGIGSQRELAIFVSEVRDFAMTVIREKKKLAEKSSLESVDLLSRFLSSGHSDEKFVTDIVISFILAGRDTTSAALTWFFWLVSKNPRIEREILNEITSEKISSEAAGSAYEETKDMVYTLAALCESMRLYPPVPSDSKEVGNDDVLPGGTAVRKGEKVTYHPYSMGRLESIWGKDWAEYRPERWLEWDEKAEKWSFVGRDPYTYPVFQAGPRICLGKEMAFLQMKRVVAGVMRRFRVVSAIEEGVEPVFVSYLTSKMKDGFPVKIQKRANA
ncbi:cytochrome P450 94A2-like [Humulus lupulus]|uniref:cytochrome P450 94A2-like n=1 Tax=Humulus lupulus TaxID=3486 RepID=UPI002B40F82E|nr:cytochrome P450 94A2-like [Humulus lupulus]